SFSSSALRFFGSPPASANASAAVVKTDRDWICIVVVIFVFIGLFIKIYPPKLPKTLRQWAREWQLMIVSWASRRKCAKSDARLRGNCEIFPPRNGLAIEIGISYATTDGRLRTTVRGDHRGVDLISDVLPFGSLWYGEPNSVASAIGYAIHRSRSHDAVIR